MVLGVEAVTVEQGVIFTIVLTVGGGSLFGYGLHRLAQWHERRSLEAFLRERQEYLYPNRDDRS
jgi:hypothetical protein